MKQEKYEQLGALEKMIYDYLEKALYENEYVLELDEYRYKPDGYVGATLTFGGYKLRCSINHERNFVCWHCSGTMENLMKNLPHIERKLVAQANRMVRENEATYKQQRIIELEKELEQLKSA